MNDAPSIVPSVDHRVTGLTEHDFYLFNEGSHFRLYEKLGAHPMTVDGVAGTRFAVWAPSAEAVYVEGDFNFWDKTRHALQPRYSSGIWEGFIPGVGPGSTYKYHVVSRYNDYQEEKADPFAFFHEMPPRTASLVWNLDYLWGDQDWMAKRRGRNSLDAPISIYEVHLGSWMRVPEEDNRWLSYRELDQGGPRGPRGTKDQGDSLLNLIASRILRINRSA